MLFVCQIRINVSKAGRKYAKVQGNKGNYLSDTEGGSVEEDIMGF